MTWTRSISGSLGLLLAAQAAWAQGNQITAIIQPASDIAVTIQIVVGIIASLLLIVSVFLILRQEAAGFITLVFTILAIVVALKAGDILAFFGPGRAVAQALIPVVITAEQAVLDHLQTLLVNGAWLALALKGFVHGRRAAGL
jgi:hypothetical protein